VAKKVTLLKRIVKSKSDDIILGTTLLMAMYGGLELRTLD